MSRRKPIAGSNAGMDKERVIDPNIREPIVVANHITPTHGFLYDQYGEKAIEIEEFILTTCAANFRDEWTYWLHSMQGDIEADPLRKPRQEFTADDGVTLAFSDTRYWLRCLNLRRPDGFTPEQWAAIVKPTAQALANSIAGEHRYELNKAAKGLTKSVIIDPDTGKIREGPPLVHTGILKDVEGSRSQEVSTMNVMDIVDPLTGEITMLPVWRKHGFITHLPSHEDVDNHDEIYQRLRQVGYTDEDIFFMIEYQRPRGKGDPCTPAERQRYARLLKKSSTLRHEKG